MRSCSGVSTTSTSNLKLNYGHLVYCSHKKSLFVVVTITKSVPTDLNEPVKKVFIGCWFHFKCEKC